MVARFSRSFAPVAAACVAAVACVVFPVHAAEGTITPEASDAAHRVVLLDLGVRPDGTPEDYFVAERLLGLVQESAAQPVAERSRLASMAAWRASDREAVLAHSRRVLQLDPTDTVAMLRLITERIADMQTVEARLAALDRMLGPEGASIDASVRSRLALDAALLRRELGDNDASLRLIGEALRFDSSNKPAAVLLVREVESRTEDPLARLEAQIALLMADPVDPHVHGAIAYALSSEGVFSAAARFMSNSSALASGQGVFSRTRLREELVLTWLLSGPERVLDRLSQELVTARAQAEAALERARELDEPTGDIVPPEEVRLDLPTEELRLAAALSIGDEQVIRDSLSEMAQTLDKSIAEQREQIRDLPPQQQAAILNTTLGVVSRMHMCRLLANIDVDRSRQEMSSMMERIPPARGFFEQLTPLILLRDGETQAALESARSYETQSMPVLIARIEAAAALGQNEEAIEAAEALARQAVHVGWGAWAIDRAKKIDPDHVAVTPAGERMLERVRRVPAWIDRLIAQPSSGMALGVQAVDATVSPGASAKVRIHVTNLAPVPLGFGSDRTISSRLLITPDLDDDSRGFVGNPQASVVETDRRLRLRPRETIAFVINADSPYTEWLLGCNADLTTRLRWRVLQDFRIGRRNLPVKGPIALSGETQAVHRPSIALASLPPADLAQRLATQITADGFESLTRDEIVAARTVLLRRRGDGEALVSVLIDAYERSSASGRILLMAELPTSAMTSVMAPFDRAVTGSLPSDSSGEHPLVVAMAIITRTSDPESPVFELAGAIEGPVGEVARIIRGRLERDEAMYATSTGGAEALAGPTQSRLREIVRRRLQEDR